MNLAERLGYPPQQRLIIIHADDVGVTHAANQAAFQCIERGSITCGSILVPCPWFHEVADYCRNHPRADLGVHLTLNSEYATYRWPALTGREAAPSLYDDQGYLWETAEQATENVAPEDARTEFRAQIEKALAAGIDVTHIDTHMGTAAHAKFIGLYISLGQEYGLPLFLPRPNPELLDRAGLADMWDILRPQFDRLEDEGFPILDHAIFDTGFTDHAPEEKEGRFKSLFNGLAPGVTHFLIHPAKPSQEMAAIAEDASHRAKDYELFRDASMSGYLESIGCKLIGYRQIRDAFRSGRLKRGA
jgi:predicted glycoside hydrolase/deacetylase ChbG (UPF0249 family)